MGRKVKKITIILVSFVIFTLLIGPRSLISGEPQDISAKAVAEKVFNRDIGRDSKALMRMILRDKNGKERIRKFEALALDDGSTRYSIIRFLSPKDIRGTTFLNISHDNGENEQYLYLPALRRTRRIVGSVKKRRFVNSDFTYEDLERRDPRKDTHRIIGEDDLLGHECWVLESIPKKDAQSQYSKIVQWITKDGFVPVKIDLYDKKGRLSKRFTVKRLEKIDGIWTVDDAIMRDLKKKRETEIVLDEIHYNIGLSKTMFSRNALGQ